MMKRRYLYVGIASVLLCLPGFAQNAVDLDLVRLLSGQVIEGYLVENSEDRVMIESYGGTLVIPVERVDEVILSKPGESALVLGQKLLENKHFTRAEKMLKRALKYPDWNVAASRALKDLQEKRQEREALKRKSDQERIESIIRHQGLKAGIAELRKKTDTDYWGSYRGKLHVLMARDRLDHLDIAQAERHLALAEQYGVDPKLWQKVRDEIVAYKKRSVLYGKEELKRMLQPEPTPRPGDSAFLARVQSAAERGERLPPFEWLEYVDFYARLNELDPFLVWAVIDTESSWRPKVVSRVGAQGLMQLMPETAAELNVSDSFNPKQNIQGGTQYMRFLLEMFNDLDTALAAYNVGPGTVERSRGIPPAGQRYIKKVRTRYAALKERFGA